LGNELRGLQHRYQQHRFLFTDVDELNITDQAAVLDFFRKEQVHVCINAAAYTAVDKAESETALCYLINETAVQYLAEACAACDALLLHVSTDFIFNGHQSVPYNETDAPDPLGVYGASKWAGEQAALRNPKTIILRTAWVYSVYGKNFVKTMLQLGATKPALSVVFDQIGTPTWAHDLADALLLIQEQNPGPGQFGVYHYTNEGVASWFDFTKAIFELKNIRIPLAPIETSQYPTPARRPAYSVLNKRKVRETFGLTIPYWRDSLQKCLEQMGS